MAAGDCFLEPNAHFKFPICSLRCSAEWKSSGQYVGHENVWGNIPDSKVHGAYMGPTWGWQDPGGPHVGPMNIAIRDIYDHF